MCSLAKMVHKVDLGFDLRHNMHIFFPNETYRRSYVFDQSERCCCPLLTCVNVDVEVAELMKAAGVAYP
jgi:hypothetical protein